MSNFPVCRTTGCLDLNNLLVLQSDLRHWADIKSMCEYVQNGGFWTQQYMEEYSKINKLPRVSPIISISEFEDGKRFVHDGHHRCVATWLAGRMYLRPDEYNLLDWNYEEYLEIAPHNNWYTPFDPRIHVRTADFANFKKEARERFQTDPEAALKWLQESLDEFRTPRNINTVPELAKLFKN
jgi:hypothetical protein